MTHEQRETQGRNAREIEAESVAYIVAGAFGFDTSTYSIDYLTSWAGADTQIIRDTASRVLTAAHQIIEALASNAEDNGPDPR